GDSFDLHSGGVDLVFPHHENEIAQSVCACGGGFAAHWFHIAHLLVDGGKMSKSLGNLHTLDDLAARGFSPMEVRYVLIGGHYRKPLNFTFDSLHAAREALHKLAKGERQLAAKAAGHTAAADAAGPFDAAWDSLNADLNTPGALGGLFTGLREAASLGGTDAAAALGGFHRVLGALGLVLPCEVGQAADVPDEIRSLAERRWQARVAKDWALSDELRADLTARGWSIKDGKDGYTITRAAGA
ncbi:MAG: cysteine--tRNA ligase, partial [Verrucomicrobia bacterium]|nr:cysteine--tRNA ligase [Verrucomicrobiota bacterium]